MTFEAFQIGMPQAFYVENRVYRLTLPKQKIEMTNDDFELKIDVLSGKTPPKLDVSSCLLNNQISN
ncbi:hypothetical protein A1OO_08475 [Enterovibrio norvegicus FF-33]|nr:hypothetical protein A1OO_08475 [Enterovibrio norvegicus FF-33]